MASATFRRDEGSTTDVNDERQGSPNSGPLPWGTEADPPAILTTACLVVMFSVQPPRLLKGPGGAGEAADGDRELWREKKVAMRARQGRYQAA